MRRMRKKDRDANVWSIAGAPERGAMRALIINVCGHSPMATSMKAYLAGTGTGKPVIIVPMSMNRKWRCPGLFKWIKRLFTPAPRHGMITRTCRNCGRTFSLPEDVQYWPDYCLECRQKAPEQTITRKCRGCGKMFSFSSTKKRWPNYCRECQAGRRTRFQKTRDSE